MTDTNTAATGTTPAATPERGSPEYVAAMVARNRAGFGTPQAPRTFADLKPQATENPAPKETPAQKTPETPKAPEAPAKKERPAHIPEKFWDAEKGEVRVEDLAKSYAELEKARSQPKKEEQQAPTENQSQEGQEAPQDGKDKEGEDKSQENQEGTQDAPQFDWEGFDKHLASGGDLSDDHKAHLKKIGVPDFMLDSLGSVIQMAREGAAFRTAEYVGGRENLDRIMDRARAELTADEIKTYDEMLASPNWKVAMDSLKARFLPGNTQQNASGNEDLFSGTSTSNSSPQAIPFANRREMIDAINKLDDRGRRLYDIDDEYRATVRQRIAAGKVRR